MQNKKNQKIRLPKKFIRSSMAEYLTFISARGDEKESIEVRYKKYF